MTKALMDIATYTNTKGQEILDFDLLQTAELIRGMLKERWPNITFSVRTSRFSGGSARDISYFGPEMDHLYAPSEQEVSAALDIFRSYDWDSFTDARIFRGPVDLGDGTLATFSGSFITASGRGIFKRR